MRTYSAKPADVTRKWYVLNAADVPLGRLSTLAATLLTGKGKPQFTRHIDVGDYVIVINASKLKVTGGKEQKKVYYRHSGFPGGLKEATLQEVLDTDPARAVEHAIRGMLPVNKLRDGRLARLKIYAGPEHQHEAQKPKTVPMKEGK